MPKPAKKLKRKTARANPAARRRADRDGAALPPAHQRQRRQLGHSNAMPHITSAERIGMRKGIEQGIEKGRRISLVENLKYRFGPVRAAVTKRLEDLTEEEIDALFPHSIKAESLEQFLARLPHRELAR